MTATEHYWRPIYTAPKDGSAVALVAAGDRKGLDIERGDFGPYEFQAKWVDGVWQYKVDAEHTRFWDEPTHWRVV